MKVKFTVGIGFMNDQIDVFDVEDLGYSEEEWKELSPDEKWKEAEHWANEWIEINYEEVK